MAGIKHATTKAPGEKVFAVADWNAEHALPDPFDIGAIPFITLSTGTFGSATITGGIDNELSIGNSASATGVSSIALGNGATATGNDAMALGGTDAQATETFSVALGAYTRAHGDSSTAVGYNSSALGIKAIAIGPIAYAEYDNEINFSNADSTFGTLNTAGGYTQLDIYNGVADFQLNSIKTGGVVEIGATTLDETQLQALLALIV